MLHKKAFCYRFKYFNSLIFLEYFKKYVFFLMLPFMSILLKIFNSNNILWFPFQEYSQQII